MFFENAMTHCVRSMTIRVNKSHAQVRTAHPGLYREVHPLTVFIVKHF